MENPSAIKLLIGHKCRRGKDCAADYVLDKYGGVKLKFADPLYDICNAIMTTMVRPVEKNAPLMQAIADAIKSVYGTNCFATMAAQRASYHPDDNVIFSDFRYLSERDALPEFITIRIDRNINIPADRDTTHSSETELDNFTYDYIIDNNGTPEELYKRIDIIIDDIRRKKSGGDKLV